MQVVSGTYGMEQIHFEASPSDRVPEIKIELPLLPHI